MIIVEVVGSASKAERKVLYMNSIKKYFLVSLVIVILLVTCTAIASASTIRLCSNFYMDLPSSFSKISSTKYTSLIPDIEIRLYMTSTVTITREELIKQYRQAAALMGYSFSINKFTNVELIMTKNNRSFAYKTPIYAVHFLDSGHPRLVEIYDKSVTTESEKVVWNIIRSIIQKGAVPSIPTPAPSTPAPTADSDSDNSFLSLEYDETNKTAEVTGVKKKSIKEITIPDTVKKDGKIYKVTGIANNAFVGLSNVKKATIGKNIKSIGEGAFTRCKKLEVITFNGTKLTSIGEDAFWKISSSATFNCPKNRLSKYRRMIRDAGAPDSVSFIGK